MGAVAGGDGFGERGEFGVLRAKGCRETLSLCWVAIRLSSSAWGMVLPL